MKKLLEELAKKRKKTKRNIRQYCGTIKLKEDAVEIQKKMRDEWD